MSDLVGEAHVDIHINPAPGEAELAAFKAKIDRDFAELDRKKAEASLQLKSTEFDAKIDKAKQELDNLEHRKARTSVELDTAKFDAEIAEAKAEIKALGREKATINVNLKQLRAANRETRLMADAHRLEERAALQSAKAERAITNERQRATTEAIRSRAELAKLSESYEKLRGRQIGLEKSSRSVFSSKSIATAEKEARKLERVASEADHVKHKIEQLGGSVDNLDPQIQRNHTLWGRWLSRLGDTSIRLGPITTSVKGLATGLGLLGPLIFELGGGLTSLVGTLGEGLAGAATVGAGALAGLVTSAAGVGFVIGPMVGEFKEVTSAATALHKAELKYGKGSEQAATAQERLNNELHGVSPIAKEAFQSYGGLKDRWKALTKAARPAVFTAFGESLKTVQSLLPAFANESTKTTQVAAKAWDGWMKSLRSAEAKGILKSIMSDFRASIPGIANGLGSLVAMLGRLSAAGAHFLPGLSNGFAEWANNLEQAVGGGQALQSDVGRLVSQMRDLGHLSQDTGSLLVHIFDAGANSGQGMVKSLDAVIKRWDQWTQTTAGKAGLKQFFGESKQATEDFMSSIGHLTKLLFEFSRATAPVANGLLQIVTWIGDLVSAADGLVGVKQIFQGIGLVLGGLWVTSKVMAFTGAVQSAARALYGLAAGEEAVAAAQASGGIGGFILGKNKGVTTVGEDAAASSRQLALFGAAAGTAEAATVGLESEAGLLSAALSPEVLIPAATIAGFGVLVASNLDTTNSFEDLEESSRQAGKALQGSLGRSAASIDRYVAAQHKNVAVNNDVEKARGGLAKLQKEGAAQDKITAAVLRLNQAERHQSQQIRATGVVNKEQIKAQHAIQKGAESRIHTAREAIKAIRGEEVALKQQQGFIQESEKAGFDKNRVRAERELAQAQREVAQAQRQEAATRVPYERGLKNLAPISQQAERGLYKLAETIGASATKKIGNLVDPKDVQRVTELGNRLTKLGRGSEVKQVAVKSQGADQTIAKLQRLQKQTNRVEGARATIKVGANDTQAQSKLKRLGALSQRIAGTKQTVRILANSSSAEQAIARLRSHLTAVVTRRYKAELQAEDKSGAAANAFHHNMSRVSSQKYQARLTAIDDASSKAKSAEGAGKRAAKQYKLNITASNSQALGAISAVQASLAGLHDKTVTVNVVTHKSGGFSGGPAGVYYSTFAQGGLSDREIQRANEQAVLRQSGPSRKVTRPTMLVGEQAPRHPEYVIATNPAYRASNERYLEDAAGEFGYDIVPAYKGGKGKPKSKPKGKGKSKGVNKQAALAEAERQGRSNTEVEYWRGKIGVDQDEFSGRRESAELDLEAGSINKLPFPQLINILQREEGDFEELRKAIRQQIYGQYGKLVQAKGQIKSLPKAIANTKKKIRDLRNRAGKTKEGKKKSGLEHQAQLAENQLSNLQSKLSTARSNRPDAASELGQLQRELSQTIPMEQADIKNEIKRLTYESEGRIGSTAEGGAGGAGGPSIGEQTAAASSARYDLAGQFSSNVIGSLLPRMLGGAGASGGAGSPNYLPGAPGRSVSGEGLASTGGSILGPGGTTIVNNFAAPPPDPHTWTQQQAFELGAAVE